MADLAFIVISSLAKGRMGNAAQLSADEKGDFTVRGFQAGSLVIKAESGDLATDWLEAALEEYREGPSLQLVLRRLKEMEGRVVTAARGVPGARILALPALGGQAAASISEAVTGAAGDFRLQISGEGIPLSLLVFAPGYALRMLSALALPGQPLEIGLDPQGGGWS